MMYVQKAAEISDQLISGGEPTKIMANVITF